MPEDIERILKYIANSAQGYGNQLKWNEIAMLKSDMMKHMVRWQLVTPVQVKDRCLELGMNEEDTAAIVSMLKRRLEGRRLVPSKGYRGFEFEH
jgi:hypothetical protein